MPPSDSAALIVARFLKTHQYSESYDAFIAEAGLPHSAGTVGTGDLTLETLLEEKKTFDLAVRFEKLGTGGEDEVGWRRPAPSKGKIVKTLPTSSNILSTTIASLATDNPPQQHLIATTADRRLHILSLPSLTVHASYAALSDAPILSCTQLSTNILLCTTMSGTLFAISVSENGRALDKQKDHSKYVVGCAVYHPARNASSAHQGPLIATAGWDNKVHIYSPKPLPTSTPPLDFTFGDPVSTLTLPTKPEALVFSPHPETGDPILLLSRTDSSFLYYYTVPTTTNTSTHPSEPQLLGKQNLAPHSNAWVAFTPSSLALHPTDPALLAVGTNSIPHMKLLIVRLLIPPISPSSISTTTTPATPSPRAALLNGPEAANQETQASQARASLAVADREDAAILIHANTMAPQTAYSTPCVVWRRDGSGAWVNGDDGVVRGVEAKTGKVVSSLGGIDGKGWEGEGHDPGSKVRCLAATAVEAGQEGEQGGGEEVVVSGGFDQRLVVWRAAGGE